MPIAAGKMRHRVAIQARTDPAARDAHGQRNSAFVTAATRWAEVVELSAAEAVHADGVTTLVTHRVTIRYYAGLDSTMRLLWGTRVLGISGVTNPDGKGIEHLLACTEEVA